MISVVKLSHFFTALIFLTSYLVAKPNIDFLKHRSGIKVEKTGSVLKIEKKNKIADLHFWVPQTPAMNVAASQETTFLRTTASATIHLFLGFTARPPPVHLA